MEIRGLSCEELTALIEGSTREIPTTEHRRLHQEASDFVRWGRRGGLRTLALYGRLYVSLLGRLEDEIRRERQRRASSEGGGERAPQIHEGTTPPLTEVLEYRHHQDGYLQLELRRYVRRDGSTRERGPYWYFQFHEGGKRKKPYLGKTTDPEDTLAAKRANPLRE